MKKSALSLLVLVLGLAFMGGSSKVSLAEDFYKGKTIRFIVVFAAPCWPENTSQLPA
jgi:hypothetical protein